MKRLKRMGLLVSLIIAAVWGSWHITAVMAQEPTPTEIKIAAVSLNRTSVERQVLLQVTEPLSQVQVIAMDLFSTDGRQALPAARIHPPTEPLEATAGQPLIIPVTFDLYLAPAGEYQGNLLIAHSTGTITVPVTVYVKHGAVYPVATLIVGIILGIGTSYYMAKGKPRDLLLMGIGHMRSEMRTEERLRQTSFQQAIEGKLLDAESLMHTETWTEAQTALAAAEALLLKWRKEAADWYDQIAYLKMLLDEELNNTSTNYLRELKRNTDQLLDSAHTFASAQLLQEKAEELTDQLGRYRTLDQLILSLNEPRFNGRYQQQAAALLKQLGQLSPADKTGATELQQNVETLLKEATKPQPGVLSPETNGGERGETSIVVEELPLRPPQLRHADGFFVEQTPEAAQERLRWFTYISYGIAVLFLAGLGFNELYANNDIFGANIGSDYLALLVWGFSAEATRSALTGVLQTLKVPLVENGNSNG